MIVAKDTFSMTIEASVRGISKGLCQRRDTFSTSVEASVRGISKGLCPFERRH